MNKDSAAVLEVVATLVFLVSIFLIGVAVLICIIGPAGSGWLGLLLTGVVLAIASAALGGYCMEVLDRRSVEHEGTVAIVGQTKEKKCTVTFTDGYVCELDFDLGIESGVHLAVWRDGRDKLKRLDIKRP